MRNTWKVVLSFTLALGLGGALAQAQPLITGNTAAFGCGQIATSDFTLNLVTHHFYPAGAGTGCPHDPPPYLNGRGLAVGGTEVFYTELDEIPGTEHGFGASQFIHVADFNSGDGGTVDKRLLVNHDTRPGNGIQSLTFANSVLYAMSGYDQLTPEIRGLNLSTGDVLSGPVSPVFPASPDSDGFAVLPNGNFLINNGGTSCIYSQYNPSTGAFVAGSTLNVPGNFAQCTGVDTDGTSLFFMVDFNGIVRTDLSGSLTGFSFWDGPDGENFIIDISLVHPVTSIVSVQPGHFFIGLLNTDDNSVRWDFQAELLKNGAVVATGLTQCVIPIARPLPGTNLPIPISLPASVPLVSGDVLAVRVSTRIGTKPDGVTHCGIDATAIGLRLFYDSTVAPSQLGLTIFPNPPAAYYLHSDGTTCTNGNTITDSTGVTTRFLSTVAPVAALSRCKNVGPIDARVTNPWVEFSTWSLAPLP